MSQRIRKKAVFVGDAGVGKTTLLHYIHCGSFLDTFLPAIYETRVSDVSVDGQEFEIAFWDSPGSPDYDRVRPLDYASTDVFVLCFSVDQSDSLRNLREKWLPEVLYYCNYTYPTILIVACRTDLRTDRVITEEFRKAGLKFVSFDEGEAFARGIGAFNYVECSCKRDKSTLDIFSEVARASLGSKRRIEKRECIIL